MPITSNISEFDKKLTDFSDTLKRISEKGLTEPAFLDCIKVGANALQTPLEANYLDPNVDPTGMAGKIQIRVGVFPAKKGKDKNSSYFIIGPDYKNSKGWQVWHLLNNGYVHDVGKRIGTKDIYTKFHASKLTVIAGKHFVEKTMAQNGDEALQMCENAVDSLLKSIAEYGWEGLMK